MANPIANAQDLKDVLDAIYNNNAQYDTYQNLTLYYNDITRTATIFTVDEEDEENTKNVIAVFNPENVVTQDNAFFVTLMKSATVNVSTEETSVYDFALGGYVNVDTLLKNICVALGVSLSNTFADANPSLYNDMINIIRNEYGKALENNAPYIMKKFVNLDTQEESYKSLVPLMCIVKIAVYLSNLGIFSSDVNLQTTMPSKDSFPFFNMGNTSTNLAAFCDANNLEYPTFADLGMEVRNKQDFINFIRMYYTENVYDRDAPFISNGLNAFDKWLEQYEAEVDWSQFIYVYWTQTTSTATNTETFYARQIPIDKVLQQTAIENINGDDTSCFGNNGYYFTSMSRLFKEDNITSTFFTLTVSHNNTTQEDTITHNKGVNSYNKGSVYVNINQRTVNNLKPKTFFKPYSTTQGSTNDWYQINSSLWVQYIDVFPRLSQNTEYKNLKLLNGNDILGYSFKKFLEKENINITFDDDDIIYIVNRSSTLSIVIFKHANTIGITSSTFLTSYNAYNKVPVKQYYKYINNQWVYIPQDNILSVFEYSNSWSGSTTLTFTQPITIDIHRFTWQNYWTLTDYTNDTLTEQNNFNFNTYFGGSSTLFANNLGEIVEVGGSSTIEGLSLIDGATYPKNVIDLNSFNQTYPNWWKTQSNNPQIIDGVLAPTVTSTQWGAVAISNTTPQTQEDADSGDIDFTDTELIDDIVDDVDNAAEDQDVPPSDPNENGIEDEGESPDDTLERVRPQLLQGGFIKQYALNGTQMQTFADAMNNPDIIQTLQRLVSNPIDAIISLQVGYIYNDTASIANEVLQINGLTWASLTNSPTGTRLNNNIIEGLDFGMIQVPLEYHTYQDYTTTTLQLYLPFVGFVHLDVNEFMGHQLDLVGSIDTLTGSILYVVSSYKDGQRRELYQFQGNCQQQVPLNQKDNTQLLTGMMQLGATALTGGVMMGAGGAALNTANAIAGNIENPNLNILKPNITHGGSVGGNVGLLGNMIPYAFVERKQIYDPKHEIIGEVQGLPANSSVVLGSLKGYTVVKDVVVKTSATQDENNEIERLLKEGVIL